jgi:ribose transport system permease protein
VSPRPAVRRQQLIAQNGPLVVAVALLAAMLVIYIVLFVISISSFPGAFEAASITDHAIPLSLAAVGQSVVVLTRGIDLSVGGMMDISNSLAALHLHGGLGPEVLWTAFILLIGAAGGPLNCLLLNPNLPTALIYVVVLGLVWSAFRRTRLGVNIFAIGNDEAAARANSVPVRRTKVLAYVLSGTWPAQPGSRWRRPRPAAMPPAATSSPFPRSRRW